MANPETLPVIEVKDVRKSFGDVHAVRGIDLRVLPGEFVALLGPNGAGKTTLVEMIEGIQKPDKGSIHIKGKQWKKKTHKDLNRIIGISLQETWFIEKLRVKETLSLFASFYKLDRKRVEEIIQLVRLEDKQNAFVKNLSGGQKQRLALGISLINYPEILLLDEPTTGLDPTARHEVWKILLKLKEEHNTSLILTTHYMEEAEELCDRIVIVDQGNILAQGTLNELLSESNSNEIIEFSFDKDPEISSETIPGILKLNKHEGMYRIEVKSIIDVLPKLLKTAEETGYTIKTLECRRVTLDDLFISMTGRSLTE